MKIIANAQYAILASQNLFNPEWTQGNLYAIEDVTNVLGTLACWVISVVGFCIVIFSILKNALSGLYVVNPQLWDKVDTIKSQLETSAKNLGSGGNGPGNAAAAKLGSLASLILSYLPNIKDLTDFADDVDANGNSTGGAAGIDKKQYFMKSIPLLVAQIFIGMLIFYGYPSQIANWIGTAGTEVISMVLNNVDPAETINGVFGKIQNVHFQTADSAHPYDKFVYDASKEAYTKIVSRLSDMEKEPRQSLAYEVETAINLAFSNYSSVVGAEQGYKVSVQADYTTIAPTVSGAGWTSLENGMYMTTSANGIITYKISWAMSNFPTGNSQNLGPTDYITVTAVATPEAVANSKATDVNIHVAAQPTVTISGTKSMIALGASATLPYDKSGTTNGALTGTLGCTGTLFYWANGKVNTTPATIEGGAGGLYLNVNKTMPTSSADVIYLKFAIADSATLSLTVADNSFKAACRIASINWDYVGDNTALSAYKCVHASNTSVAYIPSNDLSAQPACRTPENLLTYVKNGNRDITN